MENKNNIQELNMDLMTYEKTKGKLNPQEKKSVTITGEKPPVDSSSTSTSSTGSIGTAGSIGISEEFPPIQPQDQSTIKYLSNVKDGKSGQISKPFTIGEKRYQMVRGLGANNEVVMGVYCHDELNEAGENIIHPMEHFEKTIAGPMKEKEEMVGQDIQQVAPAVAAKPAVHPVAAAMSLKPKPTPASSLSEFKHFVVNNKTGKVRKFKQIEELAKSNMNEDESYMNLPQFKKHVEEKLFGSKNRALKEIAPTGDENDEQMQAKAQKLMNMIKTKIPANILSTIKTPVAKREVIAAFAAMIGVPRNQLSGLISSLKDMAAQPSANPDTAPAATPAPQTGAPQQVTERRVIKTLKVKDINNE